MTLCNFLRDLRNKIDSITPRIANNFPNEPFRPRETVSRIRHSLGQRLNIPNTNNIPRIDIPRIDTSSRATITINRFLSYLGISLGFIRGTVFYEASTLESFITYELYNDYNPRHRTIKPSREELKFEDLLDYSYWSKYQEVQEIPGPVTIPSDELTWPPFKDNIPWPVWTSNRYARPWQFYNTERLKIDVFFSVFNFLEDRREIFSTYKFDEIDWDIIWDYVIQTINIPTGNIQNLLTFSFLTLWKFWYVIRYENGFPQEVSYTGVFLSSRLPKLPNNLYTQGWAR
ncbi:MAG: hypothetical protein QXS29_10140 [Nitrososphaeria archaeon]